MSPDSKFNFYKATSSQFKSPKHIGLKSTFKIPLDEEYIINPPLTQQNAKRSSFLEKPITSMKRQEVFSCTKLSPFMQDLYKFEDVYSKANVRFNSSNKELRETPRALKQY